MDLISWTVHRSVDIQRLFEGTSGRGEKVVAGNIYRDSKCASKGLFT